MVNTLLLDAGNTLIYLDHAALAALTGLHAPTLAAAEGAAKRDYERFLQQGANHEDGWYVFMVALLGHAGAKGDLASLVARVRQAHDERNLWRRVPDGLHDALQHMREAGWRLGVVSNSEGHVVEILTEVGLASLFEVIVDSGVEGISKPDPRIFEIALERMGVDPQDAWYAGDVPTVDVEGARAAGMQAALIDSLNHYDGYSAAPCFRETKGLITALLTGQIGA